MNDNNLGLVFKNNTVVEDLNWNEEARNLMAQAGLNDAYAALLNNHPERLVTDLSAENALVLNAGETFDINLRATDGKDVQVSLSDATIAYVSENEAVATVSDSGIITAEAAGETVIRMYVMMNDIVQVVERTVSVHSHTYVYTDNGGNHTITCESCDLNETADHNYVDGICDVCGAVEEVAKEPVLDAENVKFATYTINMESSLSLCFKVNANSVADVKDFYVVLRKAEGRLVTNNTITVTKDEILAGGYWAAYPAISACEMIDKIEATLYVVDHDGTVRYSNTITKSVYDYAMWTIGKYEAAAATDAASAAKVQLAVEMLDYGTAAQKYFDYREDVYANADITSNQRSYALKEDPVPVNNNQFGGEANKQQEVQYTGYTLNFEESIYSMIKIDTTNLTSGVKEDLKMVVKDKASGAELQVIEFADYQAVSSTVYWIPITAITPANMRTMYTLQLFVGDTAVSYMAEYSAESYVNYILTSGKDATLVVPAMRYCVSAANYFEATK